MPPKGIEVTLMGKIPLIIFSNGKKQKSKSTFRSATCVGKSVHPEHGS